MHYGIVRFSIVHFEPGEKYPPSWIVYVPGFGFKPSDGIGEYIQVTSDGLYAVIIRPFKAIVGVDYLGSYGTGKEDENPFEMELDKEGVAYSLNDEKTLDHLVNNFELEEGDSGSILTVWSLHYDEYQDYEYTIIEYDAIFEYCGTLTEEMLAGLFN